MTTEPWPCDWDSHELEQLRRDYRRTFRQNLEWLEGASDFAQKMLHARHVPAPTAAKGGPTAAPTAPLNPPDTAADSA
jgi:hypothetical protein